MCSGGESFSSFVTEDEVTESGIEYKCCITRLVMDCSRAVTEHFSIHIRGIIGLSRARLPSTPCFQIGS